MRILVIEERKRKEDSKKKAKETKQLNNKKVQIRKMVEDMKYEYEETARENEIDLEKANTTVAEAEIYTEMVKKKEHSKELEQKNTNIRLMQ